MKIERVLIKSLLTDDLIRSKVLPRLDEKWFIDINDKEIIREVINFNSNYGKMPNVLELNSCLSNEKTQSVLKEITDIPDNLIKDSQKLLECIETFVKKRLYYNIALDIDDYVQGTKKEDAYADRMMDAQTFNFDDSIGFSFFEEPERIYEDIISNEVVYGTGVKTLDDLLFGGLHEKSLLFFMANTNIGKTLILSSLTANLVRGGTKVLYVTFEDPENKIGGRIAQNLLDVTKEQMMLMTKTKFQSAWAKMRKDYDVSNTLIIKEYPEQSVNAMRLQSLLKELKDKKNFVPQVVMIDYIGCMIPNGKVNENNNSNTTLKLIAEQVRAVAMQTGISIVSGSQTNRGGYGSERIGLNDAADSFSQTMKADAIFGVTQSDTLKEINKYSIDLLKTRYGNNRGSQAVLSVDIDKQRIMDDVDADKTMDVINYTPQKQAPTIPKLFEDDDGSVDVSDDINDFV